MGRISAVLVGLLRSRIGRSRSVRAGLLSVVVAATTVFATATPSFAADFTRECENSWASCQDGVAVSAPNGLPCGTASKYFNSTTVCILYNGDDMYVRDGQKDGLSAMGFLQSGGTITVRICRNKHGYGTWVKCNFSWPESGTKYVDGGIIEKNRDLEGEFLWSFSGK